MKSNRGSSVIAVLLIVSQLTAPLAQATNPPESFKPNPDKMCAANLKTEAELARERQELRDEAIELISQLKKTEAKIERRRNWNGRYENTTHAEARHRFEQLKNALHLGALDQAGHLYRTLFSDVELAYWRYQDNLRLIDEYLNLIRTGEINPFDIQNEINSLRLSNKTQLKIFGEKFIEYARVRRYLEALILKKSDQVDIYALGKEITDEEVSKAKTVLDHLGINDFDRLFPQLSIPNQPPVVNEMEQLFRTNLIAYSAHLDRIAKEELKTSVKVVVLGAPMFNFLRKMIYVLPLKIRIPISNFLGLAYDVYVRDRYLPQIERIAEARIDPKQDQSADVPELAKDQLRLLRELNAQTNDELLVTFARVVSVTEDWELLKAYTMQLAVEKNQSTYENFYNRMIAAEQKARSIGELSLFYEESQADQIARLSLLAFSVVLGVMVVGNATIGLENIWSFLKSLVP